MLRPSRRETSDHHAGARRSAARSTRRGGTLSRVSAEQQPRTILVVDDEADMRTLLERILTQAGYRVVSLGDPTQVTETAARIRPDLVLCDITMPRMDGYEVLRALQRDPSTA